MRRTARKWVARPTYLDGHRFASIGEAARYSELVLMERAGEISELVLQPSFTLVVNHVKVGSYTADFEYVDIERLAKSRGVVKHCSTIEEYKGSKKAMSRDAMLRMKLFHALYPGYRFVVSNAEHRAVLFEDWVKPARRKKA